VLILGKLIGFKYEPTDLCTGTFEIYEEDKSIIAHIRHDKNGKPLSIIDISIVPDNEKKFFFKESISDILSDDYLRKYFIYSIYDTAGIPTEE